MILLRLLPDEATSSAGTSSTHESPGRSRRYRSANAAIELQSASDRQKENQFSALNREANLHWNFAKEE